MDWKHIAIPALYLTLIGLVIVFAHSGLQGDHGLATSREAADERSRLERELAGIQAERRALQNSVRRLSDDYLDLDLLDERARSVLGLARPGEIIVR